METSVIKALTDAGLGLGSLMIMAILFIYQLKTNARMFDKFGENIDKNTEATEKMTQAIVAINETNKQMIDTANKCKLCNQIYKQ